MIASLEPGPCSSSIMSRRADDRRLDYKFQGLTSDEMRRRREETTIELRKSKREDSLSKKRNIGAGNVLASSSPITEDVLSGGVSCLKGYRHLPDLLSNDYNSIYNACHAFRKILSKDNHPPIQDVIDLKVVDRFVGLLSSSAIPPETPPEIADKIVFESAWVLTNIASGSSSQTLAVVSANAVPVFVHLLSSSSRDIQEQSVWALGNISGDSHQLRDHVLGCDAMMGLLRIVYSEPSKLSPFLPLLRNAVWTVSNLCRGKPPPSWNQIGVALPILTEMLSYDDDEVLIDACWAFSYISDGADHNLIEIIKCGAVAKLMELLRHRNTSVQTPSLRAIGNVVTGDDSITQHVVDMGVLSCLKELLSSSRPSIKKEACWAISNITAGTLAQVSAVYELQIFPLLIEILTSGDYKTKREACWALCNATSCYETAPHIIRHLASGGIIKPLCEMLESPEEKIIQVAMDGLENILQVGEQDAVQREDGQNQYAIQMEDANAMVQLWNLQQHQDTNVYLKAKNIVEKFFSDSNELTAFSATKVSAGQFSF